MCWRIIHRLKGFWYFLSLARVQRFEHTVLDGGCQLSGIWEPDWWDFLSLVSSECSDLEVWSWIFTFVLPVSVEMNMWVESSGLLWSDSSALVSLHPHHDWTEALMSSDGSWFDWKSRAQRFVSDWPTFHRHVLRSWLLLRMLWRIWQELGNWRHLTQSVSCWAESDTSWSVLLSMELLGAAWSGSLTQSLRAPRCEMQHLVLFVFVFFLKHYHLQSVSITDHFCNFLSHSSDWKSPSTLLSQHVMLKYMLIFSYLSSFSQISIILPFWRRCTLTIYNPSRWSALWLWCYGIELDAVDQSMVCSAGKV